MKNPLFDRGVLLVRAVCAVLCCLWMMHVHVRVCKSVGFHSWHPQFCWHVMPCAQYCAALVPHVLQRNWQLCWPIAAVLVRPAQHRPFSSGHQGDNIQVDGSVLCDCVVNVHLQQLHIQSGWNYTIQTPFVHGMCLNFFSVVCALLRACRFCNGVGVLPSNSLQRPP